MYNLLVNRDRIEELIEKHAERIAAALRHLQPLLATFGQDLAHEAKPAVVFEPRLVDDQADDSEIIEYQELSPGRSRSSGINALLQMEYGPSDPVNRSAKCHGAFGVPRRVISNAIQINRTKLELKEALRPIAGVRARVESPNGKQVIQMKELSTIVLRRIQSSSINLLAAYRQIPVIDETPSAIRLMVTQTRSVPKKTAAQLLEKLAERETTHSRSKTRKDYVASIVLTFWSAPKSITLAYGRT